jgi:hypothetical protein
MWDGRHITAGCRWTGARIAIRLGGTIRQAPPAAGSRLRQPSRLYARSEQLEVDSADRVMLEPGAGHKLWTARGAAIPMCY